MKKQRFWVHPVLNSSSSVDNPSQQTKMSRFRKRNVQIPIPGTRTSSQTGQVITSCGNPSLDLILGGGLPMGSICLIEEDKFMTHSKVLVKYFLAEGVVSLQKVFLGSLDDNPDQLMFNLPRPLEEEEIEQDKATEEKTDEATLANGLRIAWRYNDLPLVNSEKTEAKIGHHFNLLEKFNQQTIASASWATWNDTSHFLLEKTMADESEKANDVDEVYVADVADALEAGEASPSTEEAVRLPAEATSMDSELNSRKAGSFIEWDEPITPVVPNDTDKTQMFTNQKYVRLLNSIHSVLGQNQYKEKKHLWRFCLTSLGSPLWYEDNFDKDVLKFLTILRAVVRSHSAVCFITMPMHLIAKYDKDLVAKIRNLVDYSIELESFAGSDRETNPAFKEYNGLLHLHKMTAINTLSAFIPETSDLAFKLRRKKFVIEKLHLPPELQGSNGGESATSETIVPTMSCGTAAFGSSPAALLDF